MDGSRGQFYPWWGKKTIPPCAAASRNRQEAKDRRRWEDVYRVILEAELEIRHLHEKLDHLLSRQWERLVEIQRIQLELMSEITRR